MTTEEELALSYYKEIGMLNAEHGVALVQHTQSKRLFIRKTLTVYNAEVYRYLKRHPVANTPVIYEAVEDDGTLTVIEEYINGTSLREMMQNGRVLFSQALDIIRQLCRIVSDLHRCRPPIVHRDIKPSNIILTDDGTVKLLDMNAAKQYRGIEEQDTRLIGTAGFAAPEQYGFGSSSAQTDIYAIGVLMATMIHGSFSRSALTDSSYDRIIEKCTRLDPGDRYATADALLRDLDALYQTEAPKPPVRKSPEPEQGRFIRWLPPGFRSLKPGRMLLALFLYFLLFMLGCTLNIQNPINQTDLILNKVFFILCGLSAVFFIGNYMGVLDYLGITKIRRPGLRWLAILGGAGICYITLIVIMVIIEQTML